MNKRIFSNIDLNNHTSDFYCLLLNVLSHFYPLFLFAIGSLLWAGCAVKQPPLCLKNDQVYGITDDWIVRYDWDSSYRRGLSYSKGECWELAISQLILAIRQRPKDQWQARSYGMNMMDEYFPHRELGIVYLQIGRLEKAIEELQYSLDSADSAKTKYYLNKAHKLWLEQTGIDQTPPLLQLLNVPKRKGSLIYTNSSNYQIEGSAMDDFFVSSILINEKPVLFDLAKSKISFQKKVTLQSGINLIFFKISDLAGHQCFEEIRICLDQQGPTVILGRPTSETDMGENSEIIIKGLVFDNGGLDKLIIAGKEIPLIRGGQVQEFEISISSFTRTYIFEAYDIAGNITKGDFTCILEPKDENGFSWGNFEDKAFLMDNHEGIKVCANTPFVPMPSNHMVSHRLKRGPKIIIKDYSPLVFEPVVVIQGWIEGTTEISEVSLNGDPIFSMQENAGLLKALGKFLYGKKMVYYFTRRIEDLKQGNNHLIISARDKKGRAAQNEVIVEYRVKEIEKIGNRWCLAILPFIKHENNPPLFASRRPSHIASLDASLQYSFFQTQRFRLVERERIDVVMYELEFQMNNPADMDSCCNLGRLLSAEVLLLGFMEERWDGQDRLLKILARLVDVETGQILAIKDAYNTWMTLQDEESLLDALAQKFLEEFPILQGMIIDKTRKKLKLTLGANDLIKHGMKVLVYHSEEPEKNQYLLGEARVEEVTKDFSFISPIQKTLLKQVGIGDFVITK